MLAERLNRINSFCLRSVVGEGKKVFKSCRYEKGCGKNHVIFFRSWITRGRQLDVLMRRIIYLFDYCGVMMSGKVFKLRDKSPSEVVKGRGRRKRLTVLT